MCNFHLILGPPLGTHYGSVGIINTYIRRSRFRCFDFVEIVMVSGFSYDIVSVFVHIVEVWRKIDSDTLTILLHVVGNSIFMVFNIYRTVSNAENM